MLKDLQEGVSVMVAQVAGFGDKRHRTRLTGPTPCPRLIWPGDRGASALPWLPWSRMAGISSLSVNPDEVRIRRVSSCQALNAGAGGCGRSRGTRKGLWQA